MEIKYVTGDATAPEGNGKKVITHICNDIGGWGKGFVLALSRRWKTPEEAYRQWYRSGESFCLGEVQFVRVEEQVCVANMIGQHGICKDRDGVPPIRYDALRACLRKVAAYALDTQAGVHMPRIGAGLAGGDWRLIEKLIREELADQGVAVTVYDLK